MKRDLDLFREILLAVEAAEPHNGLIPRFEVDGFSQDQVNYHIMLLIEAQYLDGIDITNMDSGDYKVYRLRRLTNTGHDYLDQIRDHETWRKTKEITIEAGGFSLDLIKQIAKGVIATKIKKHSGIEIEL